MGLPFSKIIQNGQEYDVKVDISPDFTHEFVDVTTWREVTAYLRTHLDLSKITSNSSMILSLTYADGDIRKTRYSLDRYEWRRSFLFVANTFLRTGLPPKTNNIMMIGFSKNLSSDSDDLYATILTNYPTTLGASESRYGDYTSNNAIENGQRLKVEFYY